MIMEGGRTREGVLPSVHQSLKRPNLARQAARGGVGHHELPQAIYKKLPLPEETRKVFDEATTGPIPSRGHRWDSAHRDYNEAVGELIENFMAKNNVRPEQMTPEQAESLLKAVRESPDPRIGNYNKGIRMLQFMYRLRTGTLRGNE